MAKQKEQKEGSRLDLVASGNMQVTAIGRRNRSEVDPNIVGMQGIVVQRDEKGVERLMLEDSFTMYKFSTTRSIVVLH